ncbi:MAG: hypothetical protein ACE5FY_06100 [Nitrospiria bacterium]
MSQIKHTETKEEIEKKKKQLKILYCIAGLLVFLDIFAPRHHAHYFYDHIPGFSLVFGGISCLILIFFSKGIGHAFLMKREDFYDD